jgi:cysteine-rich repeat protein
MPPPLRSLVPAVVTALAWGCADPSYGTSGAGGDSGASTTTGAGGAGTTSAGGDAATTSTGPSNPCGDWIVSPGEQCEDGNAENGDGCSADCTLEATCGNGVVEPGEACDGADCDAVACVPTDTSVCFGGIELQWGKNAMLSTGTNAGFAPEAGCTAPVEVAGFIDTGPLPWRLVRRWIGGAAPHFARLGCGDAVGACKALDVSEELPPHSIVWLGVSAPYTSGQSTLDLQRVRYGSFFIAEDGFANAAVLPTDGAWSHDPSASTWKLAATAPAGGTLQSPILPLAGLEPPVVVRYLHNLSGLAAGAEARLEVQLDDGPFETLVSYTATGSNEEELEVPGAAGHATLRARFVVDATGGTGTTTWVIQNFFLGPPFVP